MSACGRLKFLYLAYFSKPIAQRKLFRQIRKQRVASIVEIGVGDTSRALRMISVAQRYHADEVRYSGIDMFEAAADPINSIALKDAHKKLKTTGAKINLIPGDPNSALARSANNLLDTDLLIISADCDQPSLEQAWFYIPRMLHASSLVLQEELIDEQDESKYIPISRVQVERLSMATDKHTMSRAA